LRRHRPEYHRAYLCWDDGLGALVAKSTGGQRSSRLLSMRSADALLQLPQASGCLPTGSLVTALLIGHSLSITSALQSSVAIPFPPGGVTSTSEAPFILAGNDNKPIVGVLTVSDRASRGLYEDVSGPLIVSVLSEYLATECHYMCRMVPDEVPFIEAALRQMVAAGCALVCTTGGTGPAERDVTPEAMALVRLVPCLCLACLACLGCVALVSRVLPPCRVCCLRVVCVACVSRALPPCHRVSQGLALFLCACTGGGLPIIEQLRRVRLVQSLALSECGVAWVH